MPRAGPIRDKAGEAQVLAGIGPFLSAQADNLGRHPQNVHPVSGVKGPNQYIVENPSKFVETQP